MSAKDAFDTKEKLLRAAVEVFADKGYRDATVADICDRAGANLAAVNYHFHSKENLYVEAWRLAFDKALQAHPPDGGVPPESSVEDRLRGRIASLVKRIMDPDVLIFEIIHKELANPTGLLETVKEESIQPIKTQMNLLVREMLGPKASDMQVELGQMSIMSQCFHVMGRERHRKVISGQPGLLPKHFNFEYNDEIMINHIFQFSLAGIREMRRQIESD